ncbi:chemotaxis protein CheD [Pseudobacteroides cellulosolvens]|uniref:Probable chemoreceptor glutamine deamidase CheD n=1 Tax=Pseudobacteroides cellulosolvens ATCC 35603 = DSM 2933 TaxID=398512 RepID=A0A0L6JNF6_9FIRM|nr:chemotaxis protein CheD [Pseudobacteroides cellulosolvens]KNY27289.1 CheD, deamidase, stimulates methylation of MCP protein [Pseudobacteroides cellulosolvens ATCC 35603 = DSM 2933]
MIVIGIGEYAVTDEYGESIVTYALSSCIAMTVYSPIRKVAGMVHISLPEHYVRQGYMKDNPWTYADTAVPMLIDKLCNDYKCSKLELEIKIYGGAESRNKSDMFKIGMKNIEAVNKALNSLNLYIHYSDTGGNNSRTITLYSDTGEVRVQYLPLKI